MKIHSKPIEEHAEVPLADDGRWEDIVAHWQRREAPRSTAASEGNACYLLSVRRRGDAGEPHAQLAEIASLVRTSCADVSTRSVGSCGATPRPGARSS